METNTLCVGALEDERAPRSQW